jgi:hypothetical protein
MDEGVAAFQTGTLGFFRDRVLNLDGKVNNEAVQHRADLLEYVQGKKVQWICDYEYSVEETMGKDKLRENGWRPVARRGHFALFWRDVNSIPNNPESR